MLCQDCKKREAQVRLTQIVNNEKTTLALCHECAAARGFHSPLEDAPFPLAEILSSLTANTPKTADAEKMEAVTCPNCGLSFEDFTRQGRFGCGECYKTFRSRLEMIMRKIHGASLHRGRTPDFGATVEGHEAKAALIPVKEEERLEGELKKAIESEDFERAAEIRDKLKTIRESVSVDSH
jgi:protein arginine kinase activator